METINKKKWFIGIMGVAVLISVILFWFFFVIPLLFTLQKDFVYEAEVVSSDNFYDQAKGAFSGESTSATKFSYSVVGEQNGVLIIKNIFDVHKLTGEPIFSVERLYGIDPITKKHVTGFGDKNRGGYLFAPKDLKKGEPFTYWHINYDGPAHMRFVGEETINGLTVYSYETHYEGVNIDQTKNLTNLPDVGITKGINLDPYLQLWIEPQTGTLINYKDKTTAYYYDLTTGKRLYPWNKFSNTFKNASIITQVEIAKQKKLFIFVINFGALIAIILFAFLVFLMWSLRRLYATKKDAVKNLKKLEEQQVKLQSEEVKLKNATTIASVQNTQLKETIVDLEKSKKATINILEDLQVERENLNQAKAKDEAILSSIGDGVLAIDEQARVIVVNKAACDMLGLKAEELVGRSWIEAVQMEDQVGHHVLPEKRPIAMALSHSKTTTTTTTGPPYYYRKKDGSKFPTAITVTPVILDKKTIGAIEVFRDITAERSIDQAKSEFVSIASHELRTPLTAIDGLTSMIREGEYGPIDKGLKQPLEDINTSSVRLIHLVNDLLNLSRIQSGRLKYILSDFPIENVITYVVQSLQPLSKKKGLELSFAKLEPVAVQGDSDKIKEVLNNLIGNSIKFTDKGNITVSTKAAEETVQVLVTDTGIGITKEDQGKLFGQFQQLDSGKGRPGSGLGLHISKEMIQKMGGDMWIEKSEPGKGSTFAFSLPKSKSELAKKAKAEIEKEAKENPDQKSDIIIKARV